MRSRYLPDVTAWLLKALCFLFLASLASAPLFSQQFRYRRYVHRRLPGNTQGEKITAAQTTCPSDLNIPCVLVLLPELAPYPEGTLPARPANVVWLDYRQPGSAYYVNSISYRFLDEFQGATLGEKIAACVDALPSGGGVCNGLSIQGAQTINAFTIAKPVQLWVGEVAISVTGSITIQGVSGFSIIGIGGGASGSWMTRFNWVGDASDPMFLLDDVGHSTFANFRVTATSRAPLAAVFHSENGSGVSVTPGSRLFEDLFLQGTTNAIDKGFRWVGTGGGGDANNEADTFRRVRVANYLTAAWSFEHSQSKAHKFYACAFTGGASSERGIATNQGPSGHGGSFIWNGGGGGKNSVADFDLGTANDAILINGGNFENSARLLQTAGPASTAWPVTLQGVRWASDDLHVDNRAIWFQVRGPLALIGNIIGSDGAKSLELRLNASSEDHGALAIGNHIRTALANPFTTGDLQQWTTWGNSVNSTSSFARFSNFIAAGIQQDGGGFKHARITTGSISLSSSAAVTVTWTTAFFDANYTVQCSVVEADADTATLQVDHVESIAAGAVVVRVENEDSGGAKTGTLHCVGIHD